jgi:hypothetical protein
MMKAKYYAINLNKASNRMDQYAQAQKRKKAITLVLFYFAIIVIAAAIGYQSYKTEQRIDAMRAEITSIEDKIAQLESVSDFLSPEDIFTLSEITTKRLIWSEKISILGNILPRDVAITELNYDSRLQAFMIKGVSKVKQGMKDLDLVVAIIGVIESNADFSSDFSEIKFQSSQRVKQGEQEMVNFEIACLI